MREYLHKILTDLSIKNLKDFTGYLDSYTTQSPLILINKHTANSIIGHEYDHEEGRIFKDKIEFKSCIIDLPKLKLRDSSEVSFVDCIFTGDIILGGEDIKSILVDSCIFLNELAIGKAGRKEKITIYKTNIFNLHFFGSEVGTVSLADSRVEIFEIEESIFETFRAIGNVISRIYVSGTSFKNIMFPSSQIDFSFFKGINRSRYFSKNRCLAHKEKVSDLKQTNLFDFVQTDLGEFVDEIIYKREKETLSFIINYTDVKNDRQGYSDVLLNGSVWEQKNIVTKIFIYSFGAFVKPRLILLHGLFVYLLFTFLYLLPFSSFMISGKMSPINLLNALYFSGITFTTIGYGDICPVGFTKILAVMEGAMGIFLSSSFLVSLIRKYCD